MSSRGQGHAFCARRPRIVSPTIHPTLRGRTTRSAPSGPKGSKATLTVGFTHGYSCRSPAGSTPIATPGVQPKMWGTLSPRGEGYTSFSLYPLAKGCCKTPFLQWRLLGAARTLMGKHELPFPFGATGLAGSPGVDRGPSRLTRWSSAIEPRRTDVALRQEHQLNRERVGHLGRHLAWSRGLSRRSGE